MPPSIDSRNANLIPPFVASGGSSADNLGSGPYSQVATDGRSRAQTASFGSFGGRFEPLSKAKVAMPGEISRASGTNKNSSTDTTPNSSAAPLKNSVKSPSVIPSASSARPKSSTSHAEPAETPQRAVPFTEAGHFHKRISLHLKSFGAKLALIAFPVLRLIPSAKAHLQSVAYPEPTSTVIRLDKSGKPENAYKRNLKELEKLKNNTNRLCSSPNLHVAMNFKVELPRLLSKLTARHNGATGNAAVVWIKQCTPVQVILNFFSAKSATEMDFSNQFLSRMNEILGEYIALLEEYPSAAEQTQSIFINRKDEIQRHLGNLCFDMKLIATEALNNRIGNQAHQVENATGTSALLFEAAATGMSLAKRLLTLAPRVVLSLTGLGQIGTVVTTIGLIATDINDGTDQMQKRTSVNSDFANAFKALLEEDPIATSAYEKALRKLIRVSGKEGIELLQKTQSKVGDSDLATTSDFSKMIYAVEKTITNDRPESKIISVFRLKEKSWITGKIRQIFAAGRSQSDEALAEAFLAASGKYEVSSDKYKQAIDKLNLIEDELRPAKLKLSWVMGGATSTSGYLALGLKLASSVMTGWGALALAIPALMMGPIGIAVISIQLGFFVTQKLVTWYRDYNTRRSNAFRDYKNLLLSRLPLEERTKYIPLREQKKIDRRTKALEKLQAEKLSERKVTATDNELPPVPVPARKLSSVSVAPLAKNGAKQATSGLKPAITRLPRRPAVTAPGA
ncbi:hypothetical protein [Paraburkholderia bonniea]|uniref:hypothetical protein n=1 Tax=Paraburkholderia bonniea TaxID=2152891 RepID=UPI001291E42D|nr:hypothetical protein [Paraburkholderia bonniea]